MWDRRVSKGWAPVWSQSARLSWYRKLLSCHAKRMCILMGLRPDNQSGTGSSLCYETCQQLTMAAMVSHLDAEHGYDNDVGHSIWTCMLACTEDWSASHLRHAKVAANCIQDSGRQKARQCRDSQSNFHRCAKSPRAGGLLIRPGFLGSHWQRADMP